MTPPTRRTFLAAVAAAAALPGCATTPIVPVAAPDDSGELHVDAASVARLEASEHGALQLRVEGARAPILLLRDADGGFHALSGRCTHLGCTVRVGAGGLSCPCHGSAFGRDGSLRRGPAGAPLERYAVAAGDDGGLRITLGPGGRTP